MLGLSSMMMGEDQFGAARFIGGFSTGAAVVPSSRGALGRDLVIINSPGDAPPTPFTWQRAAAEWFFRFFAADEIGTTITIPAGAGSIDIYRDCSALVNVRSTTSGGDNYVIPGVNKAPRHAGFIAFPVSPSGASEFGMVSPATWAKRAIGLFDRLYPANPLYVDGTSFVWQRLSGTPGGTLDIWEALG